MTDYINDEVEDDSDLDPSYQKSEDTVKFAYRGI